LLDTKSIKLGLWAVVVLCLASFLIYTHTISYSFVYDDEFQILRNPWIHDWSQVGRFFTTDVWAFARKDLTPGYYRPFHMMAHALGFSVSGFNPEGYHLINILLHVISTLLVSFIGLRLTRDKTIAFAGGLLFALHPIHAESVTWIAGVTDPLCAVFYFGALYLYLTEVESRENPRIVVCYLFLLMCAMLSKEMAVTFLPVAIWADWSLRRKLRWDRYGLILGTFLIYFFLRITALGQFIPGSSEFVEDVLQKFLNIFVIFSTYLVKQFVPFGINAFHHFHPVEGILDSRLLLSVAALLFFLILVYWQRKNRQAIFLFGFCLISLLPLLNIASLNGENLFADRYLYIPSLAACLLVPILIKAVLDLQPPRFRAMGKKILYVTVAAVLIIYGVMLVRTSTMWKDAPTLYTESLRKSPESIIPANLLAQYYFNRNDYEKAEPLFRRIINMSKIAYVKNNSRLSSAYIGLGGIELHRNNLQRAKELFTEANKLNPRNAAVLQNLGSLYLMLGDPAEASRYFQESLEANPRNEIVYNNLAVLNLELGYFEKALSNAQKAVEIFPKFGKAHINMAQAYAALGMKDKAKEAYRTAMEVDPVQKPLAEKGLADLEKTALQE